MELTGKAKQEFIKWTSYHYGEDEKDLKLRYKIYVNSLIIEWFDSVGIYIANWGFQIVEDNGKVMRGFDAEVRVKDKCYSIKEEYTRTRQEATEQAIIKANEIYNERFK